MGGGGDLMEKFSLSATDVGPSSREAARHGDAKAALAMKQETLGGLRQRAEELAAEAQRLEAEEKASSERVAAVENSLRETQARQQAQEAQLVREQDLLRENNDRLREELQEHQQESLSIDQRAVLHKQCGMEAESVRSEVNTILATMPKLADTLRAQHRQVYSVEVPDDSVDVRLHSYLRALGGIAPSLVCRLGVGDYLLGRERVGVMEQQGRLFVQSARGTAPLEDFLRAQAGAPAGAPVFTQAAPAPAPAPAPSQVNNATSAAARPTARPRQRVLC
jgi:hypothetical protein